MDSNWLKDLVSNSLRASFEKVESEVNLTHLGFDVLQKEFTVPDNVESYTGKIVKHEEDSFEAVIKTPIIKTSQICSTKEEAEAYIKEINIAAKLPVKYVFSITLGCAGIYYENKLFSSRKDRQQHPDIVVLDKEGMLLFEKYNWVGRTIGNYRELVRVVCDDEKNRSLVRFDREFMKCGEGYKVIHMNNNHLDNRTFNLKVIKQKALVPRKLAKNNTSGVRDVVSRVDDNGSRRWIARYKDKNGKRRTKSFYENKYGDEAKQMAIEFRDKMEEELRFK